MTVFKHLLISIVLCVAYTAHNAGSLVQMIRIHLKISERLEVTSQWGLCLLCSCAKLVNQYIPIENLPDAAGSHPKDQLPTEAVIPIMVHPPILISDISLKHWLKRVILANQKGKKNGAKLDFKNLDILEESLQILKNNSKEINFPLWLNADILQGPGSNKQPIDANAFLHLCSEYFPSATLSVGWTTQYIPDGAYTQEMVEDMNQVLEDNQIKQSVTFPIRAAFVNNSLETLEWLLDNTHGLSSTITVWSSASDSVNISALLMLRDRVGHDVVYYDLPEDQQNEFDNMKNTGNLTSSAGCQIYFSYLCLSIIFKYIITDIYAK
ncbi:unnamed protein product, partial [Meganyctiphanes norvegica]